MFSGVLNQMTNLNMNELRVQLDDLNLQLLDLINKRGEVVQQIGKIKQKQGIKRFDPVREREMLNHIIPQHDGPFQDATIEHIFKEIFKASLELIEDDNRNELLVSRKKQPEDTLIKIKDVVFGNSEPQFIVGPCAVESYEQLSKVAEAVKKQGITILRGGAFKPRTSPYDFQGLGIEGLKILKQVSDEFDLAVVSEIVNPADIEEAAQYLDIIQIGARNMQNFE